ncbi:MAG TPA: methionyl-tRNA formyltransferase, partial [Gaiellaceae bacterium]|nr:methionyl-tRNA formyltransferase [Gaiellaceae bacterium]
AETGVGVTRMEAGLDTGPVALVDRLPIAPDATAGEVEEALSRLGADLMVRALGAVERGGLDFTPQPEAGVRYAAKIGKDEARVDWSRPAQAVHDHIRGLSPFPGAWCEIDLGGGPERLKLLRSERATSRGAPGEVLDDQLTVACGENAVRLLEVQRAGKAALPADAFLRGARIGPGTRLG